MIKKIRKNGSRLLGLGLLLLLATLLSVSTMSIPQAHAQNALPKEECDQIAQYDDPENPNAVKFYAPYCQIDTMINDLQQESNQNMRCAVLRSIANLIPYPLRLGSDVLFNTTFSKPVMPIIRCTIDALAAKQQAGQLQILRNSCAKDPSNTGIIFEVKFSKNQDGTLSSSLDSNECGAVQNGLSVNPSGGDSIALLQFQETLSDDGSGIILSDVGTDASSNVALNPANDSQDVNTVSTPSAANEAG